jgi:hypothetical protein
MYRGIIIVLIFSALLAGCTKTKKVERKHSTRTVYEMYLQRGINSLNQYNATHDAAQLDAAAHYLDSAAIQKNLQKFVVVPKVSVFLSKGNLEDGRKYLETVDAKLFPRPYLKEMYCHFFDALIQNQKKDPNRETSIQQAIAVVEDYLKTKPKDKEAISDLFSLKMYSEPEAKLLADMAEYKSQHPEAKYIIDNLQQDLKRIIEKRR